ncbi:MAG TPA: hypothetical protein VIN06_12860 [Devosia sp.]
MRSFEVAIAAFFVGAAFLIAAFSIGILNFETCWNGTAGELATYQLVACNEPHILAKQVGFGLALNWSVGLCLLFPFFIYCVCETVNGGLWAVDEMVRRQMIVSDSWHTPTDAFMRKLVRRRTFTLILVVVAVTVLATFFVALQYYRVVGRFYGEGAFPTFRFDDPQNEADWSIAAPICAHTGEKSAQCTMVLQYRALNSWFSAAAYAYLVYLGAISAISFMCAFGLYVRFIFAADVRNAKLRVIPDLRSTDPRRGFEVLEDFFTYAIIGCFVLFAMGYLVTLQNVYLRQPDRDLAAFFLPLIPAKLDWKPEVLIETIRSGVEFVLVNGKTVAVTFLGLFFIALVIAAAAAALGSAARKGARVVARELAAQPPNPAFADYLHRINVTPSQAQGAIEDIRYWPMEWPTLVTTVAWLLLGIVAMLFVNFGAVIVAAGLTYVIVQASRGSQRSKQTA